MTKICFVISPGKNDIVNYYSGRLGPAAICYVVQDQPNGLCDAIFTALPFIDPSEDVLIGLPDTVWFPRDGFRHLPKAQFSFLLFPCRASGILRCRGNRQRRACERDPGEPA